MTNTKKRKPGVKLTTPFGRAGFCNLLRAGTKFDPDGEFNAKIILPESEETTAFIETLEKLYEAAYQTNLASVKAEKPAITEIKRADKPFKRPEDPDTGAKLPGWQVNSRLKRVRRDQNKVIVSVSKPTILDSKNQPVTQEIGAGSLIRAQVVANPFFTAALGSGLQLRLMGVQVKEYVPVGVGKVEFDMLPDGFVETAKASDPVETMHAPADPSTAPSAGSGVTAEDGEWV